MLANKKRCRCRRDNRRRSATRRTRISLSRDDGQRCRPCSKLNGTCIKERRAARLSPSARDLYPECLNALLQSPSTTLVESSRRDVRRRFSCIEVSAGLAVSQSVFQSVAEHIALSYVHLASAINARLIESVSRCARGMPAAHRLAFSCLPQESNC